MKQPFKSTSCGMLIAIFFSSLAAQVEAQEEGEALIRIPQPPAASIRELPLSTEEAGDLPAGIKHLADIRITPQPPAGDAPEDRSAPFYARQENRRDGARDWYAFELNWRPPVVAHHPLYFDDVVLEVYGQSRCRPLQPLLSAGRFFATVPAMPIHLITDPPCSTAYSPFGHPRPGSPANCLIQKPGH
ncbi:MAG: hypothetical protein KDA42_13300 [Planctomycetales bacterium]|nr:hypothetical protein [Planctomycetales bacterium]